MSTLSHRIRELFDLPRSEPIPIACRGFTNAPGLDGAGVQNQTEKSVEIEISPDKCATTEPYDPCLQDVAAAAVGGCDVLSVTKDHPTMNGGSQGLDIPKNTKRRRRRIKPATSSRGQKTSDIQDQIASFVPDDQLVDSGEIVLITGPSGSGKSRLMKSIREKLSERTWIDPTMVTLNDVPVIDCICSAFAMRTDDTAIEAGLLMLSRVGLAEAWTYLRCPSQLSDGQRWRLILAMMIARAESSQSTAIIAMDEFAALLDRVTAMVVSRSLRKLVDQHPGLSAVVVTSHDDLMRALDPDHVIVCDFGEFRSMRRHRTMRSET